MPTNVASYEGFAVGQIGVSTYWPSLERISEQNVSQGTLKGDNLCLTRRVLLGMGMTFCRKHVINVEVFC